MMMRVLDLFSGIGGFTLGLERTGGFRTVGFCEIDSYCRRVLAKHWPGVPIYGDIRELTAERLRADGIAVDALCGGFPCQDISLAGSGVGIGGARSGLWSEFARLIGEIRPRYAIVENVAALLSRGLDKVLGDLAALRYDAEWHCMPASAVGAPHRRDRVWVVAYPDGQGQPVMSLNAEMEGIMVDCSHQRTQWGNRFSENVETIVSDPAGSRLERHVDQTGSIAGSDWWTVESDVGRVAHGVPSRVDRLRALGNAVVPQIPELIGRAILAAEGRS